MHRAIVRHFRSYCVHSLYKVEELPLRELKEEAENDLNLARRNNFYVDGFVADHTFNLVVDLEGARK